MKKLWESSSYGLLPLVVGLVAAQLLLQDWKGTNEYLHVLFEGGTALVSFVVILFVIRRPKENNFPVFYIWIIFSVGVMGVFDFAHSLVSIGNTFVWLHSLSTTAGGIIAALVWVPEKESKKILGNKYHVWVFVTICGVCVWLASNGSHILSLVDAGEVSSEAKILNSIGGVGFLSAWLYFYLLYRKTSENTERILSNTFLLFSVSAFIFQVSEFWGAEWWLYHTLKIMAYGLLLFLFLSIDESEPINLRKHHNELQGFVEIQTTEAVTIIQTAINSIITVDNNGQIQTFNPASEELFGWSADEVINGSVSILVPDADDVKITEYIQLYLAKDVPLEVDREVEMLHKSGKKFPVHISVGYRKLGEDKFLFVAYITDFSKQKDIKQELIVAKDKAEQAVRIKADFLANMSHEIRTPMNAIIGFSEVAIQDNSLSEQSQQYIRAVLNSAEDLLRIINDILDFSKVEAGCVKLEVTCFHLSNAVQDVIRNLGFKSAEKDIIIDFDISNEVPARVLGDPTRLRQVITNLVGNAIKFSQGGSIYVGIRPAKKEGLIEFSVSDNGIGMSQEQQDNIFTAFVQADESTTRRFGGTGLGTTISKQIVELMGGEIWLESEIDRGTTFYFTVNMKEANTYDSCLYENGVSKVQEAYQSPRAFNVLLAEDVTVNAILVTLRLEQQGHKITWVENGKLAVDAATENEFDLILMDVQMPKLDGLEAARRIRTQEKENYLPIIALTASVMKEERQDCFNCGMDNVVGKPINFPELLSIMEEVVPAKMGSINTHDTTEESPTIHCKIDFSCLDDVVDYNDGLVMWGLPIIYGKSLKEFAREQKKSAVQIAKLIDTSFGDYELAYVSVHTIKGLASHLSIRKVVATALSLEQALKSNDKGSIPEKLAAFSDALEVTIAVIGKLEMESGI